MNIVIKLCILWFVVFHNCFLFVELGFIKNKMNIYIKFGIKK